MQQFFNTFYDRNPNTVLAIPFNYVFYARSLMANDEEFMKKNGRVPSLSEVEDALKEEGMIQHTMADYISSGR